MQILVELEGVLMGHRGEPIRTGILMHASLASVNRMTLLTEMSEREAIDWMNANKVVDVDETIGSSFYLADEPLFERQLNHARSKGAIDLLVTNNPEHWAIAFDKGIPSVMFGVPSYTRAEHRPDAPKAVRAWSQIEDAVRKQNEKRTQDARSQKSEGVTFK
jgi:hypothetical protein